MQEVQDKIQLIKINPRPQKPPKRGGVFGLFAKKSKHEVLPDGSVLVPREKTKPGSIIIEPTQAELDEQPWHGPYTRKDGSIPTPADISPAFKGPKLTTATTGGGKKPVTQWDIMPLEKLKDYIEATNPRSAGDFTADERADFMKANEIYLQRTGGASKSKTDDMAVR